MNIAYGVYLSDEYSRKQIFACVLSISSAHRFLGNRVKCFYVYTNDKYLVEEVMKRDIPNIMHKIVILQSTEFVERINSLCGESGAHRYLTAGIFYRLQALCEINDLLYIDNDVIFTSNKFRLPKHVKNKLVKTDFDSSCILYSKNKLEYKDVIYYIAYNKKHIKSLQYPDECIIHDGFGHLESKFKYEGVVHFGNSSCFEHNVLNYALYSSLLDYIKTSDNIESGVFETFYRSTRYSLIMDNLGDTKC